MKVATYFAASPIIFGGVKDEMPATLPKCPYVLLMVYFCPPRQKGGWRSMIQTTSTSRNQPGLHEAEEGPRWPMGHG